MQRVAFVLTHRSPSGKVKQNRLAEYKEHHQAVWPEMLDALRRTGWHNYSLFVRDDGLLFPEGDLWVGYFETPESFQAALAGMAQEEINAKWQEFMAPYFEGLGGTHADESMLELQQVFHLD
jgi:L-rhamnose mutarotase